MTDSGFVVASALADRYRIERELGAGGMATVYLAEDLKHGRQVAIKVLHPDLGAALGGDRFLAEIRTTARLQHPHILPLLDSGDAGNGLLYYVMPYVRGETLRARLGRDRQLPLAEAVRVAREVADALQHAHVQGIVHRDIKPENILLQDGHALVADFGIALAVQTAGGQRLTQTGLSLGTPQYMSPEQAMGEKSVDARSDIYALGAVTYEMIAGEPPFSGANLQAIVAKVLTERPVALRTVRDTVPASVEAAVMAALAKLPADRPQHAVEFAAAFDAAPAPTPEAGPPAAAARGSRGFGAIARSVLLVAVGAGAVWLVDRFRASEAPRVAPIQLSLDFPPGISVLNEPVAMTVSPDGRTIAAVGIGRDNSRRLYVRRLDQVGARFIAGTEGAASPTFSPDGRFLAFVAEERLKKVAIDGGAPKVLAEVGEPSGLAWGTAGLIIVTSDGKLGVVPEDGGTLRLLTGHTTPAGASERYPIALPDGRTILYTQWRGSTNGASILRRSIDPGPATPIGLDSSVAIGLVDGALIVGSGGALRAVPVDAKVTRVAGPSRQLIDDASTWLTHPAAAVSRGGTLLYQPGGGLADLVLLSEAGDTSVVSDARRDYLEPRLSPDGKRIAVTANIGGAADIWVLDRTSRLSTRLTTDGRRNSRPEWSPDGTRVLFRHLGASITELWWQRWDGGSPAVPLYAPPQVDLWEGVLSPDWQWLLYRTGTQGAADLWLRQMSGDTTSIPFARTPRTENEARFSPDGRWIAYSSSESGSNQVYVRRLPDDGTRYPVSAGGGGQPVWGPDGRSLYYVATNGGMIVRARLAPGQSFSIVARDTLVRGGFFIPPGNGHALYDVSSDGALLLIRRPEGERQPVAIVGWWDAVRAGVSR